MGYMNEMMIPEELVLRKIYLIRGVKVMLDMDLAELYGIETRRLNEQVNRNPDRFPNDFMFQLTQEEYSNLKSHFAISSWGGRRKLPYAFTEHGVLMLASVLNSDRAVKVNIMIVRIFIRMREILLNNQEYAEKLRQIESKLIDQDDKIIAISEYLRQLERDRQQQQNQAQRKRIGFKTED